MTRNALANICAWALLLGISAVVVVQRLEINRLEAQLRAATEQLAQTQQPDTSTTAAPPQSEPTTVTPGLEPEQKLELLRLRNEVAQLRKRTNDIALLQSENAVLKKAANDNRSREQPIIWDVRSGLPEPIARASAWIGTVLQPAPDGQGVLIGNVMSNSPAAQAQLQPGDVVVSVDGQTLTNVLQLRNAIATRVPGQSAWLEILRQGVRQQIQVTPTAPPPELNAPSEQPVRLR